MTSPSFKKKPKKTHITEAAVFFFSLVSIQTVGRLAIFSTLLFRILMKPNMQTFMMSNGFRHFGFKSLWISQIKKHRQHCWFDWNWHWKCKQLGHVQRVAIDPRQIRTVFCSFLASKPGQDLFRQWSVLNVTLIKFFCIQNWYRLLYPSLLMYQIHWKHQLWNGFFFFLPFIPGSDCNSPSMLSIPMNLHDVNGIWQFGYQHQYQFTKQNDRFGWFDCNWHSELVNFVLFHPMMASNPIKAWKM